MITAVTADPLILASGSYANLRSRPTTGEQSLLPESPVPASRSGTSSENGSFPEREPSGRPPAEEKKYGAASMFAAAVIAGRLPPAPTTMEELIKRIGSVPLPPEAEARIKDLLA
jgi:hypothetical protein